MATYIMLILCNDTVLVARRNTGHEGWIIGRLKFDQILYIQNKSVVQWNAASNYNFSHILGDLWKGKTEY
jgi:hypothetical protein